MLNILVVEDNDDLRRLMRIHLTRAGYSVLEACNGAQALQVMDAANVHLMIADVMMPVMDGYELVEELRGASYFLPVLMVTAKFALEDKRVGFQKGADDYMVKPIDMDEMLLRVEALLRRSNIVGNCVLNVGKCRLDSERLTVDYEGREVELRQKEFALLYKLLSYPNKIFTRQVLMDEIWGYESETDSRSVDVHIKRLREKLADCGDFEIQTIRGLGYKAVVKA